jgi:hypothetical protein
MTKLPDLTVLIWPTESGSVGADLNFLVPIPYKEYGTDLDPGELNWPPKINKRIGTFQFLHEVIDIISKGLNAFI